MTMKSTVWPHQTYGALDGRRSRRWSSGRRAPSFCWRDRTRDRRGRGAPQPPRPGSRNICRTASRPRSIRWAPGIEMRTVLQRKNNKMLTLFHFVKYLIERRQRLIRKKGNEYEKQKFWMIKKYTLHGGTTLVKKKIKFSSYISKFRGIGCKVIYD